MAADKKVIQEKINALAVEKVRLQQENSNDLSKVQSQLDSLENQLAKLVNELKEAGG